MYNGRELLIYFAVIHEGNREKIIHDVTTHYYPPYNEVERVVKSVKSQVVTMVDEEYPEYLRYVVAPPIVLFYYGDISLINEENLRHNLAVIGTRDATPYGRDHTRNLVYGVASECNIVSGMAIGIDATAHRAALDSGTKTVAVLGSGIDHPWPYINKKLYHDIINNGGLVVSEYPSNTPPHAHHFPTRNRLIVHFSKAVLITEAYGNTSGTSITATFAASIGKEVMCLPYPVERKDSFNNQLIYEGAKLIRDSHDILVDMDLEEVKLI